MVILRHSVILPLKDSDDSQAIYEMLRKIKESSCRSLRMATKQQFKNFDDLLAHSDRPVLVDFYATWCGPCQMMAPILEQVNSQLKDKLKVVKIDTDRYPHLASKHQIHALPTLVLFKNGQPVDRIEGVQMAEQLVQRLQPNL